MNVPVVRADAAKAAADEDGARGHEPGRVVTELRHQARAKARVPRTPGGDPGAAGGGQGPSAEGSGDDNKGRRGDGDGVGGGVGALGRLRCAQLRKYGGLPGHGTTQRRARATPASPAVRSRAV